MSLQLIIQGNHTTDLIAEIQNLAKALSGPSETVPTVQLDATMPEPPVKTEPHPISEPEEPKTKKLSVKEQDALVEQLIEDEITNGTEFDKLTKARQKKVVDGIEAKNVLAPDADVDSMFDDEPDEPQATKEVTADTIRDLMGKLGKDEAGDPIQDNLIAMRDVLSKFVPKGSDVKIGNVPQEKLGDLYASLNEIEV